MTFWDLLCAQHLYPNTSTEKKTCNHIIKYIDVISM